MYTDTNEEIEIDFGQLFAALWSRSGLIGLVTVLCGVLALLVSFLFITPQYQSAVTFFVSGCDVDSGMVLLEMGQTLDAVIHNAGVTYTREELERMLSAKTVRDTEYVRVAVTCADAQEAKRIADAVAEILPQRISEVIEGATIRAADQAVEAKKPVIPNHAQNTLIGASLGFLGTAGTVALREIFTGGQQGRFAPEAKRGRKQPRRR